MDRKDKILELLEEHYKGAKPGLHFRNAYELLIATILSAQCTDERVNIVTKDLFAHYPDPKSLSNADFNEVSDEIHSCGFYSVKARHIIDASRIIAEEYGGEVPSCMEELVKLPGVGRKTANVVLSNAFGIPGLAVDTHVFRVSHRLGLSDAKDPEGTEQDLCAIIERDKWGEAHHWLIYHGRQICASRKPKCSECFLKEICPYLNDKEKE